MFISVHAAPYNALKAFEYHIVLIKYQSCDVTESRDANNVSFSLNQLNTWKYICIHDVWGGNGVFLEFAANKKEEKKKSKTKMLYYILLPT